jgi:hypothetical protein
VCRAHGDVAAVTVYKKNGSAFVYWTKNAITEEDTLHGNEFAELVLHTSSNTTTLDEFKTSYFQLMHKNALQKLERRFNELNYAFFRHDKDDTGKISFQETCRGDQRPPQFSYGKRNSTPQSAG